MAMQKGWGGFLWERNGGQLIGGRRGNIVTAEPKGVGEHEFNLEFVPLLGRHPR